MQSIPGWLNAAATRQDYIWFLLAAGWVTLLVLSRRTRPPGLGVIGVAVVLSAAWEVASMLLLPDSSNLPNIVAENIGRLMACAPGLALLFAGAGRTKKPQAARLLAGAVMLTQVWLILNRPAIPGLVLAGISALAITTGALGGRWLSAPGTRAARRGTWMLVGIAAGATPLMASSGVVAELLGWPRRWLTASPVGVLAAVWQLGLLGLAWHLWPNHEQGIEPPRLANQRVRQMPVLLAVWLGLGGVLVEFSGRKAFNDYVQALKTRNRTCVQTLDRKLLAECLGPSFRLENVGLMPNPAWKSYWAEAPLVLTEKFLPLQEHVAQLWDDNPDFDWLLVTTLRERWLVTAVLPFTGAKRTVKVSIQREVTELDRTAWLEKRGYVEGPAWSPRGTFLVVNEPITAPGDRMLGWLTIKVDSYRVFAAQAPARLLTCLTVALGAIVGGGVQLLRSREQAQRTARAQAETAEAADRMKSALLAHVSHELRTPLQGILGYAELLARHPLNEEQRGWLQAQQRQSQLLLRLVNDLIDLGALQSGNLSLATRPAQLNSLLEETILGLRPRAHLRQLKLEFEADPAVPAWLDFDPDRVRQVVLNLVGNAIKFTERGGVAVRLRLESFTADTVVVEIAVADTGPGIAPAEQSRLFQPFIRLETGRAVEGAGLGLAMTLGLCRAMGGALVVESDGRTGSTFRARLRLKMAQLVARETLPVETAGLHLGLRVVVADDNLLVRELYRTHLASLGAVCFGVVDGREALVAVRQSPPPDLLLLDLSMPYVDGIEVARQLRADGPASLCIIGISAHGNPEYRRRALEAGMNDFLVKPVALDELSHCLQAHFGRHSGRWDSALPAGLREQLHATFQREVPAVLTQLETALAQRDWPMVEARAHYLKSSAWVLERHALADCCQALCAAAQAGDEKVATEQLMAVKRAVWV